MLRYFPPKQLTEVRALGFKGTLLLSLTNANIAQEQGVLSKALASAHPELTVSSSCCDNSRDPFLSGTVWELGMPAYIVKVILGDGSLRPPLIANCSSEDEAIRLVKLMADDAARIEIVGVRDHVMEAAFGNVPEGGAVFRNDWIWSLDGEKPEPQ